MKVVKLNTMVAKQQYLLYDENCPLCNWYTRMFVKFNFIASESRVSYQKVANNTDLLFDRERAKSEIALISIGEETLYGIDSMLKVLGTKWSVIPFIGNFFPIYWILQLCYRFISFNRKIIAPTVCQTACSCTPKFSLFWRLVFIGFCGGMTYFFVGSYFNSQLNPYLWNGNFSFEFTLFMAQLVFQTLIFKCLRQFDIFTYLGHLAFISLLGAIALGWVEFVLGVFSYFNLETTLLAPFFFGVIVCFMIIEHGRRVKLLGLSSKLTLSLVLFRILIYPLVFTL